MADPVICEGELSAHEVEIPPILVDHSKNVDMVVNSLKEQLHDDVHEGIEAQSHDRDTTMVRFLRVIQCWRINIATLIRRREMLFYGRMFPEVEVCSNTESNGMLEHLAKERQERMRLWSSLMDMSSQQRPWVVLGDFNIIRNNNKRCGGRLRPAVAMDDFNNCIDACRVSELQSCRQKFSWCNGQSDLRRSWARLDRGLINALGFDHFSDAHLKYLFRSCSDHAPMVLSLTRPLVNYGYPSFKFQQMWVTHDRFLECVSQAWSGEVVADSAMVILMIKLKRLKVALRNWNKNVFGRTEVRIENLEERIKGLERDLQEGFSEDIEADLVASQVELYAWLECEEQRISYHIKQGWLKKGEASSSFFRNMSRRKRQQVQEMKLPDGSVLSSPKAVHNGAILYFHNFLAAGHRHPLPSLESLVQQVIQQEDNDVLCSIPTSKEVYDAIVSIPIESSPGPDGFGSGFYRACWHIIGGEVVDAVVEFFSGLQQYEECSGQVVNNRKSSMVFSKHITEGRRRSLLRITGFSEGNFPFTYLGVPIVSGGLLSANFEEIINKVRKRLEGWKTRLLSNGTQLLLLKHVLQSLPIHCLSMLNTPKSVIGKIERLMSTFFWGTKDGKPKRKWKAWGSICKSFFARLVGMEKAEEIVDKLGYIKPGKDLLIWLENPNGQFSTHSAWQCIRTKTPEFPWTKWVWNTVIPKKMLVTMWKAMHECLAVDDQISKLGIPTVSRCDCCSFGGYEDLNHVLATGEFGEKIWNIYSVQVGMPNMVGRRWRDRVECWHRRARSSS
ncbi:hypothetical protein F2P56_024075 [Juglans regia]|uniref:Reverse transcriptase zinc-binding domain-containing protein n=1 Tax=Juglans regia TaxID=51240 RepID=A0A833UBH1_JUGRE|nr:hypothetical protein F2P56_024075 [Juglans regia]